MTDKPEEMKDEQQAAPEQEPVETFYDEEDEAPKGGWHPGAAFCEMKDKAREKVMECVPLEVTEHLANSRKEFILAGIAFAESRIRKIDEHLAKAREMHST